MKNLIYPLKSVYNLRNISKFALLLFVSFSFVNCNNDDDNPVYEPEAVCDTNNSEFDQLYQSIVNNNNVDDFWMDLITHSYNFKLSANKNLCKIGYQAYPGITGSVYEIELKETASQTVLYSGFHSFSDTSTSYIDAGVTLYAGVEYTISRSYDPGTFTTDIIGRGVHGPNLSFPANFGDIQILSSNAEGYGGPVVDFFIPYIDLVFEQ